jgi:hypothetical protein
VGYYAMSSLDSDPNTALHYRSIQESRNFGSKSLTGTVFLDVAKAFDTVWVNGLLH